MSIVTFQPILHKRLKKKQFQDFGHVSLTTIYLILWFKIFTPFHQKYVVKNSTQEPMLCEGKKATVNQSSVLHNPAVVFLI